jgi:hypothetical protein
MALKERWGASITALVLETDDITSKGVKLAGAAIVTTRYLDTVWGAGLTSKVLTACRTMLGNEREACICTVDELVLLSLSLSLPIYTDQDLFENLCMDARLRKTKNGEPLIEAFAPVGSTSSSSDDALPTAWEIFDPSLFLRLSTQDKREILRRSGVSVLPRSALGVAALDAALLELMDEAVRGEVLRLRSPSQAQRVEQGQYIGSGRQLLLESMGNALQRGDLDEAERPREQFILQTLCRADPTQAVGAYDPYLDQDDWYLQDRKRAMGGK